ncbi:hypothetical protein [Rhodopila sp.]|uniref:COG3904 family protein n=1 Tax=Rhodopila sp. TaxID=2480087 RepID=UPI003D0A9DAD
MSYLIRLLAMVSIMIFVSAPGQAAVIKYDVADGLTSISISGEIVAGDADSFARAALSITGPTVVVLNSKGGVILQGMMIGELIREKGYATAVTNDAECASACGLIWLAGTPRLVGRSASIGFHAAYIRSGDDVKETGVGNALVGAYLAKLGLSYEAVAFATSASPNEIRWLHPEDAEKIGIPCITLPDPKPQEPHPAPAARVAQALPDGSPLEQRMINLVLSYYASWSDTKVDASALSAYYSDTLSFYGTNVSRADVMGKKARFSTRWPVRHYTVRINTLYVRCSDTCSVTGVVEWDVSSVERGAHSVGAANFVLKIVPTGSETGGLIISENGSVLLNHIDAPSAVGEALSLPAQPTPGIAAPPSGSATMGPPPLASTTTAAYVEGRQARISYEQWYAALPDGSYRDGVMFWASNRSLKFPPSCSGEPDSTVGWRQGCAAARARLANVDRRRKTEKDYWWGWNSL